MATAAAPETEDPQRPTDTAAGALLACLSDACASPAAAYRPAPPDAVAAAVALLARPAAQISSDDDDSSKTSSLHGSESSKSLSSSPPPSQREAAEQSRKDIRRERNREDLCGNQTVSWVVNAIEQTQERRQPRVDGVESTRHLCVGARNMMSTQASTRASLGNASGKRCSPSRRRTSRSRRASPSSRPRWPRADPPLALLNYLL